MEKNTIEDQKYFYLFRALNKGDHADIEAGITSDENGLNKIRTDGERFKEANGKVKYDYDSKKSLEETWDHIRTNHSLETNCISLSSDANVSISYGGDYFHEYIMIKVPKTGKTKVYNAGDYMLDEVDKRLNQVIAGISKQSKIQNIINQIENADSSSKVREVLSNSYTKVRSLGKYIKVHQNKNLKLLQSVTKRLQDKQYFNDEQQLRYNKIIAKLTVLEIYRKVGSILTTQNDNTSLVATIESAYLSAELLHYKSIEKDEFVSVSKEMMDLVALLQQLKEDNAENAAVKALEGELVRLVNEGYALKEQNGKTVLTNGANFLELGNVNFNTINQSFDGIENKLTVEEVYRLTEGRVDYLKAKSAIEFAYKLSISRQRTLEYTKVIGQILDKSLYREEIEKMLIERGFTVDKDIVTRVNNEGVKLSNSVNIGINAEGRQFVIGQKEQLDIIERVRNLPQEELGKIISFSRLSLEEE